MGAHKGIGKKISVKILDPNRCRQYKYQVTLRFIAAMNSPTYLFALS